MYCTDIVTNNLFQTFLEKNMLNKEDLKNLANLFEKYTENQVTSDNNDYDNLNKILFLYYTEKIGYDHLNNFSEFEQYDFNYPYSMLTNTEHLRDYIVTVSYEHYSTNDLIEDQMKIIDSQLADNEKKLLKELLSLSDDDQLTINLIRYPDKTSKILQHAICEKNEYILKFSNALNKNYLSSIPELNNPELVYNSLLSILNKIINGTIHY